jgi:hypothetical protein
MFNREAQSVPGPDGRPPAKPGQSVKFFVENPAMGARSSTWSAKTGKSPDDVYLYGSPPGGPGTRRTTTSGDAGVLR